MVLRGKLSSFRRGNEHFNLKLPAKQPLTIFPILHSPSPPGRIFQSINTVTPPVPHDINVATTADPIAFASPDSLTEAYIK